ncbi:MULTISPECIES: ABC transporter substrate-binding protein [unclassified Microbacterium]|uniref:ABC transporter substrate-binding protein n=1 Tax=unclassified Microbacterium TaxID=2609290 RepID=UPI001604F7DF|nr:MULTISPECIES: ABC transporter substrate-binding protein [unclassified Microbacterium]QNA93570.1 substrate-binding domain-containing protein [Microbacterium sp. Se63.02b]QYM63825.1 substrate-binding domain-containing protein [Microbacterium sp. Se5.02b]
MNATRKVSAVLAATTLVVALASCSSGDAGDGDGGGEEGDAYSIALIPGVANDAYYGSVACGVQAVADENGATVDVQAPNSFSPTDQIPILQSVIATSPDAIIIAPTDSKALYAPLREAVEAGITVVLVDTTLDDPSIAVSQVSSDNEEAGKVAAETLAEALGDETGSVITVNLTAGVTTTDAREAGFAEAIAGVDGLEYLGQQYSNNSVQTAESIVSAAIAANPDLVGVFSTAAFNTEGAVAALKSADMQDTVKVVGFNANPPGIEQISNGDVFAQVVLKPYDEGVQAAEQAFNALNGDEVEEVITTGALVATADNLDDPEIQKYLYSFDCPAS